MAKNTPENKQAIVDYYRSFPVYKYAAASVGIKEDTLKVWRDEDEDFQDQLDQARSQFFKQKVTLARPEFLLERLDKQTFKESKDVELSGTQPILVQFIGADSDSTTTDNNDPDRI